MIELIVINNFKSLDQATIPLKKFNCLIGVNGAGKSTVLQVLDFISQIMTGHIQDWLDNRGWSIRDLNCKLGNESNIAFNIVYKTSTNEKLHWSVVFNRALLRCTVEHIWLDDEKIFHLSGNVLRIGIQPANNILFLYQGSILSVLKDSELLPSILEFRDAMRRIRSLELLSPHLMRKSARSGDVDIGAGGEKLAAYLHGIKGEARVRLVKLLQRFYPQLVDFKVTNQRAGWKKLSFIEQFEGHKLETDATHISDGLLRILAVLAQADSDRSLLLLDEIENGINPEIIEKLVDALVDSEQQIVVTTHSPMILNYLEDETARHSVQFIYKTSKGETRVRPFFSIPRIGEKLSYMGPGEAFVDTDLAALTEECVALDALEKVV